MLKLCKNVNKSLNLDKSIKKSQKATDQQTEPSFVKQAVRIKDMTSKKG